MCFRPAEADAGMLPVSCPTCGKRVFPTQGELPLNCPFCENSLEGAEPISFTPAGSSNAPAAPAAPGAPVVPAAPTVPAVPKAKE